MTATSSELHITHVCLRQMAESRRFQIVGHFDVPKKFGFRAVCDLTAERDAALDAIAAAGMTVEINLAGWDKVCAEPYPAPDIIRACRAHGIPLLITNDAHACGELGRHFARAAAWLDSL